MCGKLNSVDVNSVSDMVENEYLSWASSIKDSVFYSAFQEEFAKYGDTRTKYIIWKLGNPTGEISLNVDEIHTEHIMPQTLSDDWMSDLEKSSGMNKVDVEKTHDLLINKIGNFALIKGEWNISMSNRVFLEKVKHYINSEIGLTKRLADRKDWTFKDVLSRTEELAKNAVQIWKFTKPIPEIDLVTDNLNLRRREYSIADNIDLFCKGPDVNAVANIIDNNSIMVHKGSLARLEAAPNFIDHNYKKLRDQLMQDGVLKENEKSLLFVSDYNFTSASAAAAIILGRSADGPSEWKDRNGKSIYELSNNISNVPDNFNERLEVSKIYSKNNIEETFSTNFGARIKGITLRRDSGGNQYIILFHVISSIYKDIGTKDKFIYFGEGAKGDQKLTAANQALISAIDDKRRIYGFWQLKSNNEYEYIGELKVDKYEYIQEGDRKLYRFEISKLI